ncbi:MAG TPA: hypothetical protein VNQ76_04230 [Planctomicrobium sp.]|nr:hypothetical protein [Planctomicrobium sp.]
MSEGNVIPRSYQEWKECIMVRCQINLTREFVTRRLGELRNPNELSTREFVRKYGQDYTDQVIGWFAAADAELAPRNGTPLN